MAASLVEQAHLSTDDVVVEIGAGRGVLTAELARRCGEVRAVELDARLCEELRERFRRERSVSIIEADFLRYPLPRAPYKVLGNIPFNRTADIVRRLTDGSSPPEDAYLVVQREAGQRFSGRPLGGETLVSLTLKPWWHVEVVRSLRASDFEPPPRVDTVVLWLARRKRPLIHESEKRGYLDFVRGCFGREGRTIARCLRREFTRHQIQRLANDLRFELSGPPSSLSFRQWLGLFRFRMLDG